MKFKKHKKAIIASASLLSVLASTPLIVYGLQNSNSYTNDNANDVLDVVGSNTSATTDTVKPLVPSQANGQNSFLSTSQGPLVFWGNTIKSLDWFGALRWSIDFGSNYSNSESSYSGMLANGSPWGTNSGAWQRAWYNWDYDRTNNILWVLTYGSGSARQKIVSIDASSGIVTGVYERPDSSTTYRFISALSSGNVMVYGGASDPYTATAVLWRKDTQTFTTLSGNSANSAYYPDISNSSPNKPSGSNWTGSKFYFYNLIPIKSGYNLVCLLHYPGVSGLTGDQGATRASYKIYFVLVDDNLNMITTSGVWGSAREVVSDGLVGFRNTSITPQRDYYSLLDGRVATVVYNTVVMIDPTGSSSSSNNGVTFNTYQLTTDAKWVLSWSFDTNQNFFYKFKSDKKIYKVNSSELQDTNEVSPVTYFDLEGATVGGGLISKYAENFILYNVYGYQGQIMLINSWYSDYININLASTPTVDSDGSTYLKTDTNKTNNLYYGLAVAITQNAANEDKGDSKGLLNTSGAFQFSADFNLSDSALATKLPSEITRNDLTFTNDGFLTTNSRYTPFTKEMDDRTGTLKIIAYVAQVPWFVSDGTVPDSIAPTRIEKTYTTDSKIASRVTWKDVDTDYDFKNTLPSKVDQTDITRFDPAVFNIDSQTVTNASGETVYPKKEYTLTNQDDTNGTITVSVTYTYIPLDVDAVAENALTYTTSHNYTIFKLTDNKAFNFIGRTSTNTSSTVAVSSVPQLAGLLESDVLPSTFASQAMADTTNQTFLQFVNTNTSTGYPTSKMTFTAVGNDTNGTLTITAQLPDGYYTDVGSTRFSITYTGLHQTNQYSFYWRDTPSNITPSSMLASDVDVQSIFSNFVTYSGFNPLDLNVTLTPNDTTGTLIATMTLSGDYPTSIKTRAGFTQSGTSFVSVKTYTGFMTTSQLNDQYKLTFKSDTDSSLLALKQMTADQIESSLNSSSGLTINNVTYTSVKDLAFRLLVSSVGASLPSNWSTNNNITASMYKNNGNGTITIVVTYPQSETNADSDLTFVGEFTGFALGNDNPTSDVFSFKNQTTLETTNPEFFQQTADSVSNWLQQDGNLSKIISYTAGQYTSLISNGSYTLDVTPNTILGTVSIKITFTSGSLTNTDSLYSYAVSYSGLLKS